MREPSTAPARGFGSAHIPGLGVYARRSPQQWQREPPESKHHNNSLSGIPRLQPWEEVKELDDVSGPARAFMSAAGLQLEEVGPQPGRPGPPPEHRPSMMKEYSAEELAAQPIGYWTGEAYRRVVGRIRSDLAEEDLTQPHWWIINHVAGAPGRWTRVALAERLAPFDDLGIAFDGVFDDLTARGWMREEDGTLTLTEAGEASRLRVAVRSHRANDEMKSGIEPSEYATAINVLRRLVANLGGSSDLP